MLNVTIFNSHLQIIYMSSDVHSHSSRRRMTGEELSSTHTKERKNWKVIVDSESCVNTVSSKMIEKLGLKVVPHSHPYKVSWINSTILNVKQQCLFPIEFDVYKDKIWCNVVTMDVGQIILGWAD